MQKLLLALALLAGVGVSIWMHSPKEKLSVFYDVQENQFTPELKDKRWLVINYWATWCAPCLEEMPELEAFYQQYKQQDIAVWGVHFDKISPVSVIEFAEKLDVSYPLFLSEAFPKMADYRVTVLPTTVVLDSQGDVYKQYTGKVSMQQLGTRSPAA